MTSTQDKARDLAAQLMAPARYSLADLSPAFRDEIRDMITDAIAATQREVVEWLEAHDGVNGDTQRLYRMAREHYGLADADPLIACPHWSPGMITMRRGCTACAADQQDRSE